MRQRLIISIILIITYLQILSAQNISVKSFRLLPDDLTARVDPVTNDNGQTCALVKIVTTERGFSFEPDALGMCGSVDESQTGEVWIWVSPGSRRLTIKHNNLGVLRGYEYPVSIESACTYEMVLVTGRVTTIVEEQNRSNFLALTVSPPEAMVKIDGAVKPLTNGQMSTMLPVGEHSYELYCKLYHPQSGKFVIEPEKKTVLNLQLNPNFGFLSVSSNPTGATVFIDGSNVGTTPYTSERLQSGSYTVQVAKDMYKDATKQVTVDDNQTTEVSLTLAPNFAEPVITCSDREAEIWINEEKKGTGHWSGRLPAGDYRVEARKASHRPTSRQITLETGNNTTVTLEVPSPIVGKVSVNSSPFGADIILDGQKVGTTPEILNQVLIGTHELRLEKTGCAPLTRTVIVEEGKTAEVSIDLAIVPVEKNAVEENPIERNAVAGTVTDSVSRSRDELASTDGHPKSLHVRRYRGTNLLFTLNGTYATYPQWSFGFRIGTVRRVGWNISFLSNYRFKGFSAIEPTDGGLYAFSSKKNFRMSATAGILYRPIGPLLLVLNVGYGYRCAFYQSLADYNYYYYPSHTFQGVDVSLGMILNIRRFLLSAEAETINFKYVEFKFGIGGLFKIRR